MFPDKKSRYEINLCSSFFKMFIESSINDFPESASDLIVRSVSKVIFKDHDEYILIYCIVVRMIFIEYSKLDFYRKLKP